MYSAPISFPGGCTMQEGTAFLKPKVPLMREHQRDGGTLNLPKHQVGQHGQPAKRKLDGKAETNVQTQHRFRSPFSSDDGPLRLQRVIRFGGTSGCRARIMAGMVYPKAENYQEQHVEIRVMWTSGPSRRFSTTRGNRAQLQYEGGFVGMYVCQACGQPAVGVYAKTDAPTGKKWVCKECRNLP